LGSEGPSGGRAEVVFGWMGLVFEIGVSTLGCVFDEDGRYGAYRAVFGDGVRLLLLDRYCVGGFVAGCCRYFGVVRE
jgi:hypothetical protein